MISTKLRIGYILPHDLKICWNIIEMWSFQLLRFNQLSHQGIWLYIYLLHHSFSKITSLWGVRIFLRANIIICVLFTFRVSLLESNHNATLVNSVLRISIALSIESFWTYTVVSSAITTKDRTLLEFTMSLMYISKRRGPRIDHCGHSCSQNFFKGDQFFLSICFGNCFTIFLFIAK